MLDDFSLALIRELEQDAYQGHGQLSRKLSSCDATIRRRIRRLLEQRAISIVAVPNMVALGCDTMGLVGLQVQLQHRPDIVRSLTANPSVRYVAGVTGRYDFMVIAAHRSRAELGAFIEELSSTPGVTTIETFVQFNVFLSRPWSLDVAAIPTQTQVQP